MPRICAEATGCSRGQENSLGQPLNIHTDTNGPHVERVTNYFKSIDCYTKQLKKYFQRLQ